MGRAENWFRRVGRVALTLSDGTQVEGFGAILPWGEEKGGFWGEEAHPLGRLATPLYRFVGSFPAVLQAQGARLTQGEAAYRVLRPQEICLGGRPVMEQALLERWEDNG